MLPHAVLVMSFVYLDYNATTPIDPKVAEAIQPTLSGLFGNPSSPHRIGREAKAAVTTARQQVADGIGVDAGEILFTSGGSESNNLALRGAHRGGHIVTTAIEHPAVLEVVRALGPHTIVPVDGSGRVRPEDVEAALRSDTTIVSVMLANNEVGTIQPIAEIAKRCRSHRVLVHTDAAQAVGKIPVDARALGVDMLTIAGHKLYAPKGVGALYVRDGVELEPQIRGAGHERGLRAGTENLPGIVGLGAACALIEDETVRLAALRDRLQTALTEAFPAAVVHAADAERLPNTLSIALPDTVAHDRLVELGDRLAGSAGAACHSADESPSHVLAAMGVSNTVAQATIRLSVGRFTTDEQIDEALRLLTA